MGMGLGAGLGALRYGLSDDKDKSLAGSLVGGAALGGVGGVLAGAGRNIYNS